MASELAPSGEAAVVAALTSPGPYVALHTSAAGTNPPTSEVLTTGGTNYGRQQITAWTSTGSNPTVSKNSNIVSFNQALAAWGTINQFSIWSAVTGGNMLGWGDLTAPKAVNINDTARFAANSLTITVQ
jgi:hypothetical protein